MIPRRETLRRLTLWSAASPLLRPQSESSLAGMVNVFDFDPVCKLNVTQAAYDYVTGGAWDEWTVKRNREAFTRITFRPRMLVKVDRIDLSTELFGLKLTAPILIAPTGTHILLHPDGEVATMKGAVASESLMVVSGGASLPLDRIAEAAGGSWWYQLYAGPDKDETFEKVERAVALGAKAVCWTVDTQYEAPRERDVRNRLQRDSSLQRENRRRAVTLPKPYGAASRFQAQLDWSFLRELVAQTKVPLLVKGVLTAEDALRSAEGGAAGVVVSNHGGRFLDGAPSTIEMLPEIVDAVGPKFPVLIDGGFRRGTDVLKALAIGARAVLVGRPPLWGLGAFGDAGVRRVMEILRTELAWAMGLAGRPSIASLDRGLVRIER